MKRSALAAMLVALAVATVGCDDGANTSPPTGMDMDQIDPDMDPVEMDMTRPGDMVVPDMEPPGEDMGVDMEVDMELPMAEACDPCEADEDCADGAVCLFIGEAAVCSVPCDDEGGCPDGYTCVEWDDAGEQCVPEPEVCLGCDAPGEAVDDCDGFDNDCDGNVDEDFVPESCGEGACVASSVCARGMITPCVPAEAAPDDTGCDGVDDDCDGVADEDYVAESCGEGLCVAQSACDAGAVLACMPDINAALPQDNACDDVDEDCDGTVDEDYVGEPCGVGACRAVGVCRDGVADCTPGAPLAEQDLTCNGTDEDCDGTNDEDYASDEFCGFGECRVAGRCADGDVECVPLEPRFAIDQNCGGEDEDCDGQIDENCVVNTIALVQVAVDAQFVTLDLVFSQAGAADENNARFFQPRVIDLYVRMPPGTDVQGSLRDTVQPGEAAVLAEKLVRGSTLDEDPRVLRVQVLSINNDNRIGPGVIARLELARNGSPPWDFQFVEPDSAVAPPEADEVLELGNVIIQ